LDLTSEDGDVRLRRPFRLNLVHEPGVVPHHAAGGAHPRAIRASAGRRALAGGPGPGVADDLGVVVRFRLGARFAGVPLGPATRRVVALRPGRVTVDPDMITGDLRPGLLQTRIG